MYNSLKAQITFTQFNVLDMQRRVQKVYAMGGLSEEQLDELFSLIVEKANPDAERPEMLALIQKLFSMVEDLSARVKAFEDSSADEEDAGKYPEWAPWDGLSNLYQPGTIVSHKDQLWVSTYAGQNVWEPGTVDSRFWDKYTVVE